MDFCNMVIHKMQMDSLCKLLEIYKKVKNYSLIMDIGQINIFS